MKKYIVALVLAALCCGAMMAQGKIDKVINSMEGKADVETTYTERRSPKKKKLVMTSRIFNFDNRSYYEKLKKAMEEERSNSVSAVKTNTQMTYRFDDDKGVSTYTLSWTAGGASPYVMVMTWRSNSADDSSLLECDPSLDIQMLSCVSDDGTVMFVSCDNTRKQHREAVKKAAKERREAMKNAARARREAARARREAARARREAQRAMHDANSTAAPAVYQL